MTRVRVQRLIVLVQGYDLQTVNRYAISYPSRECDIFVYLEVAFLYLFYVLGAEVAQGTSLM